MSKVQRVLKDPDLIAPRGGEAARDAVASARRSSAGLRLTVVSSDAGCAPADERIQRPLAPPDAQFIVGRLEQFVRAHIGRRLRTADLVAATGVSETTLRLVVRAQAGQALRRLVLNVRLDQARAWLSSERELRSLREIAAALSFRHLDGLSRAYGERFGESMTETRRRAVLVSAAPEYRASNWLAGESVKRVDVSRRRKKVESASLKY